MAKKVVRLTESEMNRLVKKVLNEQVGTGMENLPDSDKQLFGTINKLMASDNPKTIGSRLNAQDQQRQQRQQEQKDEDIKNFARYFSREMRKNDLTDKEIRDIYYLIYFTLTRKNDPDIQEGVVWNQMAKQKKLVGFPDFDTAKMMISSTKPSDLLNRLSRTNRFEPNEEILNCFIEKFKPVSNSRYKPGARLCKPEFAKMLRCLPSQKLLSEFFTKYNTI